jgi:hypothetical protein
VRHVWKPYLKQSWPAVAVRLSREGRTRCASRAGSKLSAAALAGWSLAGWRLLCTAACVDWASLAARLRSISPSETALRPAKTQPIFARDWSRLQSLAFLDEPCHGNKTQHQRDNTIRVQLWRAWPAACSSSSDARERLYMILRRESRLSGSDTHELDMQDDETKDAKLICNGPEKVSDCLLEVY